MLFLVNSNSERTPAIAGIARELSLIKKTYASAEEFAGLLRANARKLVFLRQSDLDAGLQDALSIAAAGTIGVIACGPADSRLDAVDNVEWVDDPDSIDVLREAARSCWQRMLKITRGELQSALDNREFVIQYQPKVERGDGFEWRTREAESLLRWRHPQHGLLGPVDFLPEVEVFGMMAAVTEHVLDEAAKQLLRWHRQGMELNSCINLAPSLLGDARIADRFAEIVRDHSLECSHFTFEVPESDFANSDAPHLRTLRRFRELGFRISLDDFGVAASSLSAFEQMPFDEIKIHASALQRAKSSPVAQQVLAAVTGLAHNLGISVCAEGVEDLDTFEFLTTIRCDKMQGFLISEAVMPDIIRRAYNTEQDVDAVA